MKLIIIGGLLLLAILIMISEYRLQIQNEYYTCYLHNEFKKNASDNECHGATSEESRKEHNCKHCKYYKNYKRRENIR